MSASRGATFRRRYREVRALSLKSVALWVSQAAAALVVVAALISCDKERLVFESVWPSYILWEASKEMEKEQQTAYLVSCPPLDEMEIGNGGQQESGVIADPGAACSSTSVTVGTYGVVGSSSSHFERLQALRDKIISTRVSRALSAPAAQLGDFRATFGRPSEWPLRSIGGM